MSSSLFLRSMQDSSAEEEAGALPKWILQILSQDEREGLLRLSIFPLAITMEMATCVLPSTCKSSYCCCCSCCCCCCCSRCCCSRCCRRRCCRRRCCHGMLASQLLVFLEERHCWLQQQPWILAPLSGSSSCFAFGADFKLIALHIGWSETLLEPGNLPAAATVAC